MTQKYVLSAYNVLGTDLGTEDVSVNLTGKNPTCVELACRRTVKLHF